MSKGSKSGVKLRNVKSSKCVSDTTLFASLTAALERLVEAEPEETVLDYSSTLPSSSATFHLCRRLLALSSTHPCTGYVGYLF